jgi:biopolymer transport protein ExbD
VGTGLANYNITYNNGSLTVNKATLTVTPDGSKTKTYGSVFSAFTGSYTGDKNGDTFTISYASTGAAATATVASYDITVDTVTGDKIANYTVVKNTATGGLTVNAKALTITASNQSKTYGTELSLGTTAFTAPALESWDSITGVTLTSSGAAANAVVNNYNIVPSVATGTGLSNYNITYANGTLTVNAKSLTITANAQSKTYGTTFTFTGTEFTTSGLVNADAVTSVTLTSDGAVNTAPVGNYNIVPSAAVGTGLSNYTISYVNGTLTVNPAGITVTVAGSFTANNKVYDGNTTATILNNSLTLVGVSGGDEVILVPVVAFADKNVANGIVVSLTASSSLTGAQAGNYNLSLAGAPTTTANITRKALTVTAPQVTKEYDGLASATGVSTVAGLVSGDAVNAAATLTFDTKMVGTNKTVTPSAITIKDGANANMTANYNISYVANNTSSITQKALTVTAPFVTKPYDGNTSATGTCSIGSLVSGDDIATQPTLTYDNKNVGAANKTVTPGGMIIKDGASADMTGNYDITYTANTVSTITKAPLTVTAQAQTRIYDGTNTSSVLPLITSGLLQGSDTATLSQTFDNKNVGFPKTITPAISITDGNSGNNYAVTLVNNISGTINQALLTITAVTQTRTYDGTATSSGVPTVSGVQTGDNVTGLAQAFDSKHVGTGKTITISTYTVNDGNSGNNYSVNTVADTTGVITTADLTITAVTQTRTYNGNTTSSGTPTVAGTQTGDSVTGLVQTFDTKHVGTGKTITVTAYTVNDGNSGGNYSVTTVDNTTGAINKASLTINAATENKTYDGTADSSTSPSVFGILPPDSVVGLTQAFDNRNYGIGKTISVTGYSVIDGNSGNNYNITVNTTTGSISQRPISVTAVTETKTYDATPNSSGVPTIVGGLGSGDTANFTQAFDNKNVGSAKTLTPTGSVTDGNSGNNYFVTFYTDTTGVINKAPLTITAVTDTKTYDANATSSGVPTVSGLQTGDSVTGLAQAFLSKNAGSGKLISVSTYTVNDGFGGGNYSVSTVNNSTGVINKASLTITAVTETKTYDGTATSLGTPTVSGLKGTDSVTGLAQAFDTRNAGTGKTISVTAYTVNDGNLGNNYIVSTYTVTNGVINKAALTITAAFDSKTYDGTDSSSGTPTVSGVQTGDSVTGLAQLFDNRNAGAAKRTYVSGYTINDGNSGNNYALTLADNFSSAITKAPLTITALSETKVYDGTATSSKVPTVTGVQTGDTVTGLAQAFDNKNVGSGKKLSVSAYTVNDGNGGNNYTVTPLFILGGEIKPAYMSIYAVSDTKTYDGAATSSKVPTESGLIPGDTLSGLVQAFDTKHAGTGKTLTVTAYAVNDGNGGNNYIVTTVPTTTGVISPAAMTIVAVTDTKTYDGNVTSSGVPNVYGTQSGDSVTGLLQAFDNKHAGTGKTISVTAYTVNDGNSGNNYNTNTVVVTSGKINQAPLTLTTVTDSKTYDGTNSSSGLPIVTGLQTGDSASGLTQAFDDRNAGIGKTIRMNSYTINDGNGGNNYNISFVNTTGSIAQRPITVTAATDTKIYDRSITSSATPTITSGSIATGDTVTWTQTFDNWNVGTGKVLTPAGVVSDGNSGNNYSYTYATVSTGAINKKTLAVTGVTADNKVYDAGITATINISGATLSGVIFGDTVNLSTAGATGAFADKNVGTSKTVNISGLTISGADSANYILTATGATATADITHKFITFAGVTSDNKVYDGTLSAAVNVSAATLSGVILGDTVTLSNAAASGTFADKNVGLSKTVTISGLSLSGTDGANYALVSTGATSAADITPRAITVTATGVDKIDDGTTTATVTLSDDRVSGDILTDNYVSATFADSTPGTNKTVTVTGISISGTDSSNYTLTSTTATTTATITVKENPAPPEEKVDEGTKETNVLPEESKQLVKTPEPELIVPIVVPLIAQELVNINVPAAATQAQTAVPQQFGFNATAQIEVNVYGKVYLPGKYITVVTVLSGENIPVEVSKYDNNGINQAESVILNDGQQVTYEEIIE